MKSNIKMKIKENEYAYYFIKKIRHTQNYITNNIFFNVKNIIKLIGIADERYFTIKKYKGIHNKNERCFIVATGPSLTDTDLDKLENEITFSMNSICLKFEDIKFRPTYYGIQDEYVYSKIEKDIKKSGMDNIFISDRIARKYIIPKNSSIFSLNLLNHNYLHSKYNSKFSDDCFKQVYDGYTITYSLIQIAVYMGFKEIYLVGADTNYDMKKMHYVEHGVYDPTYEQAGIRMIEAYKIAKDFADRNSIKIFNATRGGMLEVFERVDLDELL